MDYYKKSSIAVLFVNKNNILLLFLFTTLFILTILPLLLLNYPVFVDYYNHLASFYIQSNLEDNIFLKNNYGLSWDVKPNVIIEWLGGFLVGHINVYMAGKIMLIMGFIFLIVGALLIRKHINGHIDKWMTVIFILLYNHVLYYGFINYYISCGLALISMFIWMKLRDRSWCFNFIIFSYISTLLFYCHLVAFGAYVIFVVSYEIGYIRYNNKNFEILAFAKQYAQFIIPLFSFLIWIGNRHTTHSAPFFSYGSFANKIIAILSPFTFQYNQSSLIIILLMMASLFLFRVLFPSKIRIHNEMKIPLLSFGIISILTPSSLAGTWGLDFRMPFIFMTLFVASIKFDKGQNSNRFQKWMVVVAILITFSKLYLISETWKRTDRQYREFSDALQIIQKGSKVITIQDDSKNNNILDNVLYHHMSAIAVIERSAFWPNLFSSPVTPVTPSANTLNIDSPLSAQLTLDNLLDKNVKNGDYYMLNAKIYWENWTQDFDYLISIRFDNLSAIDLKNLNLIFRGSFFDIYQITH